MINRTANEQELRDTLVDIASPATAEVKIEGNKIPELSIEQLVAQLLLKLVDTSRRVEQMENLKDNLPTQLEDLEDKLRNYTDNEVDTVKYSYVDEAVSDAVSDAITDGLDERIEQVLSTSAFKLVRD